MRRLAAILLVAGLLAAVWFAAIAPLVERWTEAGEAVTTAGQRLAQVVAAAEGAGELETALAARRTSAASLFGGASDALAAAQVQDRLKAAAAEAGATLSSVQVLPSVDDGPFRRIVLKAELEAPLPALQRLLHTLEGDRPPMVLDTLSLRPAQRDDLLAARLDLFAFARLDAP
jgi:general secretion pathway protein M